MEIQPYLQGVIQTLRDDVLPELRSDQARAQVINCLRVLSRLAIGADADSDEPRAASENTALPASVRAVFGQGNAEDAAPPLTVEIAVNAATVKGLEAASAWLASEPWVGNPEKTAIVQELLHTETRWRSERLQRMAEAEIPMPRPETGQTSGSRLNEITLLAYLRKKLGNPELQLLEYRLLTGGRTRKSAMFKLGGHRAWPECLVVQCDTPPGYTPFPGASSQVPALEYIYRHKGINVPRPLLYEPDAEPFGTPFMIVERMPGEPASNGLNFFAPPPQSEALALSLARQMGVLHSLDVGPVAEAVPNMLPKAGGWPGDLESLIITMDARARGPSLALSASFAWMRRHVQCATDTKVLVHGDILFHNLLREGDTVSAILDWDSVRVGHPGEDIGYVRPFVEQMVPWERFLATYGEAGGHRFSPEEADYFTLRAYILMLTMIANSRDMFEGGKVRDIRAAEVGCSFAPQFVNCVAETIEKILARQSQRR